MKTLLALLLTLQASAKNFDFKPASEGVLVCAIDQRANPVRPRTARGLLDSIAHIESNGNPKAIGDKGRSLGAHQMSEAAWCDVNAIRRDQGLPIYAWKTGAHDLRVSRIYAEAYLTILRNRLTRALNRAPSNAELYSAYSLGMTGFRRAGFNVNNCPAWLQRKAKDL